MIRETAGCRSDSAFFEPLEARLLLSVMLDNGLPTNALDYFAIYVDGGGGSRQSRYAGTDTIYDYFPYLEIGGEDVVTYNLLESFQKENRLSYPEKKMVVAKIHPISHMNFAGCPSRGDGNGEA